jgi:hypothetical protein
VTLDGKDYFDVDATLNGTGVIPGSPPYNVPAEFLYPVNPGDCNGTGIVDLLNNSAMILLADEGVVFPPLAAARDRMTDEFFGRKGYSYVSVQWEKTRGTTDVIGLFNQNFGTNYAIPHPTDQFSIILDASTALRSPPAGLPGNPCAVSTVAGYGMSASTVPLNILKQPALSGPAFAAAFANLYDGIIWDSITAGFLPFPISKTGVKTMAVSAETDVQLFGNAFLVRGENPEYRSYEVAGVTHVSIDEHNMEEEILPILPFTPSPPTRQNLATHSPFFRAVMEHLRVWMTDGTPPPPSVSLDGGPLYPFDPIACEGLPIPGIARIPRDADGNALGGIRLPFLSTDIGAEKPIGSPLGVYNGMETQYPCKAGGFEQVVIVMGTYVRDDDILDRYTNPGTYISGVAQAAEYALEQSWLLEEDKEAYIQTATQCVVGHVATEDITLEDLKACHGL